MSYGYQLKNGLPVSLPSIANEAVLREASADDLRVLICLSLSNYTTGVETIAKEAGLSLTRAAASVEYWMNAGILIENNAPIKSTHLVSDVLPKGSTADDARIISEKNLKGCFETCAQILGKVLNTSEINILVAIINDLNVSEAYLTTLLDFCVKTLKKNSVKYLEKMAVTLTDNGVCNDAALDEYIKLREAVHPHEKEIRSMWGMGARQLTTKEQSLLFRWFGEFGYDMSVINIAYELTASKAERVSLAYTNKILEEWHSKGLKTPEEIKSYIDSANSARTSKYPPKKNNSTKPTAMSYDPEDFLQHALNSLDQSRNKQKKSNEDEG